MAITRKRYNTKTHRFESEKISQREMKATIMRANDWTEEQYRKQYDIFKNKLRFYEELQRSRGIDVETQSIAEVLYKEARSKITYGPAYEPSDTMRLIRGMAAYSTNKGSKIASRGTSSQSYKRAVSLIVNTRFAGLIARYDKAAEIAALIKDPVILENALSDFAAELHSRYPRAGKDAGAPSLKGQGEAIPSGEVYGSDFANIPTNALDDYDIEQWLN